MMKALFVSDLQLEAGLPFGSGEYGPGSRFDDQEMMLGQIVSLVDLEDVQLVCVLGDVFERSKPSPWAVLAFQRFVRTLREGGRNVFVLNGNHDVKSAALPPILSVFEKDVGLALTPTLAAYGDIVIAALPWASTATLLESRKGTREELHSLASGALLFAAEGLVARGRELYPGSKIVLAGHWAVGGASLPTNLPVEMLGEPVIPITSLVELGYDVGAFGHIHKAQLMAEKPPTFYCGSPMVMNWGEGAEKHGVWIYDTGGTLAFRELADREFITYDYNLEEVESLLGYSGGDQFPLEDALIRLRWEMTEDEARALDQAKVRQVLELMGARKVFLQPRIIRKERNRDTQISEDLNPEAALHLWLDSQEEEFDRDFLDELLDAHNDYRGRLNG